MRGWWLILAIFPALTAFYSGQVAYIDVKSSIISGDRYNNGGGMILALSLACLAGSLWALWVIWKLRPSGQKPETQSQGNAKDEWRRDSEGCARVTVALLVLIVLIFGSLGWLSIQWSGMYKLGK